MHIFHCHDAVADGAVFGVIVCWYSWHFSVKPWSAVSPLIIRQLVPDWTLSYLQSLPFPSNRQHLSFYACLEDKKENNQNCSVLCYVWQLSTMIHTCKQFLHFCMFGSDFFLCVYVGFVFYVFFHVSLGHFVLVLLAFVGFSFFST